MKKIKIGLLYICTGQYAMFWKRFHRSTEEFLFTEEDIEKHYFVFTDSPSIQKKSNIHTYFKTPEGFPTDSIKRFELFLSIQENLQEMDYVYFLNANMDFVQKVGKEILPAASSSGLVGLLHPGYFNSSTDELPYERDPNSTAFIPYIKNHTYQYFMGSFNGGRTNSFLEMCETCYNNILEDAKHGIMACFHDESHINAYFLLRDVLALSPEYGFPEDMEAPFVSKIIILDKAKHYGDYFVKEYANPFLLPSPLVKNRLFHRIGKTWTKLKKLLKR